jgi:hypothetical protein
MDGWRKSTYSDANGGQCLEATDRQANVLVRDTTNRSAETLAFSADAWRKFTDTLK